MEELDDYVSPPPKSRRQGVFLWQEDYERLTAERDTARAEVGHLNALVADKTRVAVENYNALWGLLYPVKPESWEYPGQIINHLRIALEDVRENEQLRVEVARLSQVAEAAKKILAWYPPDVFDGSSGDTGVLDIIELRDAVAALTPPAPAPDRVTIAGSVLVALRAVNLDEAIEKLNAHLACEIGLAAATQIDPEVEALERLRDALADHDRAAGEER